MTYLTHDEIVADVLKDAKPEDYAEFKNTPFEELCKYHHGFGMFIRNEYKLWAEDNPLTMQWLNDVEDENCPYIVNGVDNHPLHPDARSMRVLEDVWKKLNDVEGKEKRAAIQNIIDNLIY